MAEGIGNNLVREHMRQSGNLAGIFLTLSLAAGMAGAADPRLPPGASNEPQRSLLQRHISFANLWPQERILIDFRSYGCMDYAVHYRLRFSRMPKPRFAVSLVTGQRGASVEKDLGVVELSPERVIRLDNLLRFYRGDKSLVEQKTGKRVVQASTATDKIMLSLVNNGRVIRQESYEDRTGISRMTDATFREEGLENPEIISLEQLAYRME